MGNHISLFFPQRDRFCEERGGAEKDFRRQRQVVQGAAGDLTEQGKSPGQEKSAHIHTHTTVDFLETLMSRGVARLSTDFCPGVERGLGWPGLCCRGETQQPRLRRQHAIC